MKPLKYYWYKLLIHINKRNINDLRNELDREINSLNKNSKKCLDILSQQNSETVGMEDEE